MLERSPWRIEMLAWQGPLALALLAWGFSGPVPGPLLPAVAYVAAVSPELLRVDLAEHRLPDRLTLPGYPVALAGILAAALAGSPAAQSALLAGGLALALFLALSITGGMGLGDVKLAGVLGLVLGGAGPAAPLGALLTAFVAGGVGAVVLLLRSGRGSRLAFGPFLLLGFWLAVA